MVKQQPPLLDGREEAGDYSLSQDSRLSPSASAMLPAGLETPPLDLATPQPIPGGGERQRLGASVGFGALYVDVVVHAHTSQA